MTPQPRTILIVDDEATNRLVLSAMVRSAGHRPLLAANGVEALGQLSDPAVTVGAVLLDRSMPEPDGLEVLRQLRRRPEHATLPVIVVTAGDRPEDVEQAFAAGADDYLVKPVGLPALIDRLQTALLLLDLDAAQRRRMLGMRANLEHTKALRRRMAR